MSLLHLSLSIPSPLTLSSSSSQTLIPNPLLPLTKHLTHLTLKPAPIRMGGGPRTYPGGVSKWQWKRMQAKKSKQLLKARLARERSIYEMRKRAELKAAVSELERPWESVVDRAPNLFSVSADEQLKVLADRFQKPGGMDLWVENDGPELFRLDGLERDSQRFFPKGVVHSVRPYGKVEDEGYFEEFSDEDNGREGYNGDKMNVWRKGYNGNLSSEGSDGEMNVGKEGYNGDLSMRRSGNDGKMKVRRKGYNGNLSRDGIGSNGGMSVGKEEGYNGDLSRGGSSSSGELGRKGYNGDWRGSREDSGVGSSSDGKMGVGRKGYNGDLSRDSSRSDSGNGGRLESGEKRGESGKFPKERLRKKGSRRINLSDGKDTGDVGFSSRRNDKFRRGNGYEKSESTNLDVFDVSLQDDGSYGIGL